MATVAGLTVLQPSPYLCQLLFILLRGLVGHERLALGVTSTGGFFISLSKLVSQLGSASIPKDVLHLTW